MTKRRVQGGEATSERRRRDGSQYFPLFVLFVLFGQAKRTLKEKNHNVTFPLSYFCMTKSIKSYLRGLFPPVSATPTNALRALVNSPLLKIFFRVHELVARSSAWQVCAANDKAKIGGFALSTASSIPRVRTYHTKKPSRFVHALSARPHNRVGGREFSLCADGIKR